MEAIGPLLILLAIPFVFRLVPPNRFCGFRIPPTLSSKSVWYDANALCGRHLLVLGLLLVALEFVVPSSFRIPVLRTVAWVGVVTIIVADWRTAARWRRERESAQSRR